MTIFETGARFHDLTPLLRPRSIAVIGASEQPGNLGGIAVSLMRKFGYGGEIWPVNPKRDTVHGLRCYPSPEALPRAADLAVIATGAELAVQMVHTCAAAGIRHGIIWAGGYAETGEAGARLQDALVAACRETGFILVGPNCIGIINSGDAMVASFASFLVESTRLLPGDIAMISQSGGLATMAQALAQLRGVGFGLTVSTGNEAMLTVSDYIHAVASDERTKVVAAYVEGVRDGPRFIEAVGAARRAGKPVVVLKGGLSASSAQAAAAHTGALAGERRVWEAMARQLGIISASSLEELIDICLFLSATDLSRLPAGGNVAVVSFGGGSGVLAADLCEARGLAMPQLGAETRERLRKIVTPIASVANPVDLTPQTFNQQQWFDHFPEVLDTIAADPDIDIVLLQFGPQAQRGAATARAVADFARRSAKTVCLAWPLAPAEALPVLDAEGLLAFADYDRAIATLARLAATSTPRLANGGDAAILPLDWDRDVPAPKPGLVIGENECHRILAGAGVAVAGGRLAVSEEAAVEAAAALGFPLAAKGISPQVTHRAAAGLVALDLRDEEAVRAAFRDFLAKAAAGGYTLDGVYLQKMAAPGLEIIVSAFRDPDFGVMVSCGAGGNLTELMEDVAIARAPLSPAQAEELLGRLRITAAAEKLGRGARMDDLAGFVSHFSRLAAGVPWRNFVIEINPVRWNGEGAVAVDGLIIIQEP